MLDISKSTFIYYTSWCFQYFNVNSIHERNIMNFSVLFENEVIFMNPADEQFLEK